MKYIRVAWKPESPDDPEVFYGELDADRNEVRKVEVFRDGRYHYASAEGAYGDTGLSCEPIPELSELATDPQFEPVEITREEFEEAWVHARVRFPRRREDGSFTVLAHFWSSEAGALERAQAYVARWIEDHRDLDLAAEFSADPRVVPVQGGAFAIVFDGRPDSPMRWKDWLVLLTKAVSEALIGVQFERFES